MTPVKNEGSSHRKGKEITADNPATKTVGEDTPLSELEHSEEEEWGRDPDSKCAPLIDLWYEAHAHFSMVPDDYSPLPLGNVWLSICCSDTEVSWAPLASSISNLGIRQGTSLPMPILFEFG